VRIRTWDGSEAGPDGGPVVLLRSPRALRRLLWHPGELGLVQAAYWTSADEEYTLTGAQRDKLELICRKLALTPGTPLLDVGCGWGSLTVHAARRYQARVTAVTLSQQQGEQIQVWRLYLAGGALAFAHGRMGVDQILAVRR
jgi:cyclopropane fatty-acyl-phospholipid synthase-like methyltransferase